MLLEYCRNQATDKVAKVANKIQITATMIFSSKPQISYLQNSKSAIKNSNYASKDALIRDILIKHLKIQYFKRTITLHRKSAPMTSHLKGPNFSIFRYFSPKMTIFWHRKVGHKCRIFRTRKLVSPI